MQKEAKEQFSQTKQKKLNEKFQKGNIKLQQKKDELATSLWFSAVKMNNWLKRMINNWFKRKEQGQGQQNQTKVRKIHFLLKIAVWIYINFFPYFSASENPFMGDISCDERHFPGGGTYLTKFRIGRAARETKCLPIFILSSWNAIPKIIRMH